MPGALTPEDLRRLTGYERPSDVRRCLDEHAVRYLTGKGGQPFTTIAAMNAALGLCATTGETYSNEDMVPLKSTSSGASRSR